MPQIRPNLECTDEQLKRLDRTVDSMNAGLEEGAPRHSRQSVTEGVDEKGLEAAISKLEKKVAADAEAAKAKAEKSAKPAKA